MLSLFFSLYCFFYYVFMYVAFVVLTYFRVYSHSCCRLWAFLFLWFVCLCVFGLCAYFDVFYLCVFLALGCFVLVADFRLRLCVCLCLVSGLRPCVYFLLFLDVLLFVLWLCLFMLNVNGVVSCFCFEYVCLCCFCYSCLFQGVFSFMLSALGAFLFLLFVLVFCLDCVLLRWSCCLFFVVPCVVVCLFCGCCRAFFCVLSLFGGVLSACWFSSSLVSLCFC